MELGLQAIVAVTRHCRAMCVLVQKNSRALYDQRNESLAP
jgi:hypothetical protein